MISACFALATTLLLAPPSLKPYQWHDEMDNPLAAWTLTGSQNDPVPGVESPGVLTLTMPQVPVGYPHSYQWRAVTRTIAINTEQTPLLVARVSRLSDGGHTHLDVEVRDYELDFESVAMASSRVRFPSASSRSSGIALSS